MDKKNEPDKNPKQEFQISKRPNEMTKVSLWLDDYENLFSDFDPRAFSHRELSDDFINETMKCTSEVNVGKLILILLIPLSKKNTALEKIIKIRLHSHFQKQFHHLVKGKKEAKKKGYYLTIIGISLMIITTLVSHYLGQYIFSDLLRVIMEPAGWFTSWYGLDYIFYLSRENKKGLEFYKKMADTEIKFDVY